MKYTTLLEGKIKDQILKQIEAGQSPTLAPAAVEKKPRVIYRLLIDGKLWVDKVTGKPKLFFSMESVLKARNTIEERTGKICQIV